jgi:pimeloyl-ACP methyl ester carboxylesterase
VLRCGSPRWFSPGTPIPIVPLINGRILARCIPRARLKVIAGGGHLFLLERPAEMARLIATFLRSEPPLPSPRRAVERLIGQIWSIGAQPQP